MSSYNGNYFPKSQQRKLFLKNARHPCVELMDSVSFLPNDYDLNEQSSLQLITGPNMGGKVSYFRSACVSSNLL
jgi:DNA mismatch repair protein MSH2